MPMAGRGQRFRDAGFHAPKPFIDVAGRPMIERVLENLAFPEARYILVCREEHIEPFRSALDRLRKFGEIVLVPVNVHTEGSACTILFAREHLDNDDPLLIANSDQLVDGGIAEFVRDAIRRNLDGSIMTFEDSDPKWSYARLGPSGLVEEVQEKKVISDEATVGIYYYRRGADFMWAAVQMIIENNRSKGEFYTCPTYNYAIGRRLRIGTFRVAKSVMHGLGTPEDLEIYLGELACSVSSR